MADKVKRHFTEQKWSEIRKLFALTVEYTREAVKNGRKIPYSNATQAVLYQDLMPLNDREKKLVLAALTNALSEQDLQQSADRLLIVDLKASL
jgi:hypothetical protein